MFTQKGSVLFFRLFGISVYVHWMWLIAAVWRINGNMSAAGLGARHGVGYSIAWLLGLFGIVLMHEFGHALACKSVGGKSDLIVLQPLGGIAYVRPPERPGALLWTIAAGPLVNVVLLPITFGAMYIANAGSNVAVADFANDMFWTNLVLLIFNILPIYPLDGGQILRSLLWFVFGRSLSLIIASSLGLIGTALLAVLIFFGGGIWIALLVAFMAFLCIRSLRAGITMWRLESGPRHHDARCPSCNASPPAGPHWRCACGAKFDTFDTAAQCPGCAAAFTATACPLCGKAAPLLQWYPAIAIPIAPETAPNPYAATTPGPGRA